MKKLVVSLTDEIDAKLRKYVQNHYKNRRGALSIVVEEAIILFLKENEAKNKVYS